MFRRLVCWFRGHQFAPPRLVSVKRFTRNGTRKVSVVVEERRCSYCGKVEKCKQ